jgi:hypothetical protein
MKKLLIFQIILFVFVSAMANLIVPEGRLIVSEIYFEGSEWIVEAVASPSQEFPFAFLDSVIFETSSGQSYFKPGIELEDGQIIIITKDSLITPLSINPEGDFINMKEYEYGTDYLLWELNWYQDIKFGNYEGATCTSPFNGQSLVLQRFELEIPDWYTEVFYWLVKENNPTPGSNPFTCNSRDTVSGYIYDKLLNPVNSAELRYCAESELWGANPDLLPITTNENGYFENTAMFSKMYKSNIIYRDSLISNVSFNVEIDSLNIYNFIIENYIHTGIEIHETANAVYLSNYPNPVTEQTTISVTIPQNIYFKNAVIKIFNINGQIVDIIPLHYNSNNIYNVIWSRSDKILPGRYFFNLDINNKKVASNNMLIVQ